MTNAEINKAPINDAMKRALKALRQAPVFHNILDMVPSACTWNIRVDDMENHVLAIAKEWLGENEVKMVTIDPGFKGQRPFTCIWLKKDSRHLIDKGNPNKSGDQVINVRVERFSDELKKFADNFAPSEREDGTPISRKKRIDIRQNLYGDQSIVAIPVDISKILWRIFDVENRAFLDTFGADASSRKCSLDCKAQYVKKGDRQELSYIKVTKYFEGAGGKARPKPRRSFQDKDDRNRRRDDDNIGRTVFDE